MVVDLRQDPRIDMANARAIGQIFAAIGKREGVRQQRQQLVSLQNALDSGMMFNEAIGQARNTPVTYDKGPMGILQGVGNVFKPQNFGNDMLDKMTAASIANRRGRGQGQEQQYDEQETFKKYSTYASTRDKFLDDMGEVIPGRETEYAYFDKKTRELFEQMQRGGVTEPRLTGDTLQSGIDDYMQQSPDLRGGKTEREKRAPAAYQKYLENKTPEEIAEFYGQDVASQSKHGTANAGQQPVRQAPVAGQTSAEFYKYFDKLDEASRQQLIQILQGTDEEKKKIALERLRKTYGSVR